jgi:hypothetical protein
VWRTVCGGYSHGTRRKNAAARTWRHDGCCPLSPWFFPSRGGRLQFRPAGLLVCYHPSVPAHTRSCTHSPLSVNQPREASSPPSSNPVRSFLSLYLPLYLLRAELGSQFHRVGAAATPSPPPPSPPPWRRLRLRSRRITLRRRASRPDARCTAPEPSPRHPIKAWASRTERTQVRPHRHTARLRRQI